MTTLKIGPREVRLSEIDPGEMAITPGGDSKLETRLDFRCNLSMPQILHFSKLMANRWSEKMEYADETGRRFVFRAKICGVTWSSVVMLVEGGITDLGHAQ